MPRYILLTSLTPEGRKTLKERPYRMKEVDKEIESMGIKILSQYATLGPFDFVNVVEAPDNLSLYLNRLVERGFLTCPPGSNDKNRYAVLTPEGRAHLDRRSGA